MWQSQDPSKVCQFKFDKLVIDNDIYIYNEVRWLSYICN